MESSPPPRFFRVGFISLVSACFLFASVRCNPPILGVHPLDEKYYASDVIKCKDGSKSFIRDRLNDDFCDCIDGTDEPGTSACAAGKFYCRNAGSIPQFIFSSRINDRFCDCCDGSDEYEGNMHCPNTCVMGGNFENKSNKYTSKVRDPEVVEAKTTKDGVHKEDSIEKLKGLKMVIILQVVLISCGVGFRIIRRRLRSKRRRNH